MLVWEREVRQRFVLGEIHQVRESWPTRAEAIRDPPPCGPGTVRVWLIEDGADGRGDHLLRTLRYQCQCVPHEMGPAALPTRTLEHGCDRGFQPLMRITGDEFDAAQSTRHQAAQEGVPECAVFTGSHIEPEYFTLAVPVDTDGDDDRHADDAVLLPDLHKRRVELDVRIAAIELARTKALDLRVQC